MFDNDVFRLRKTWITFAPQWWSGFCQKHLLFRCHRKNIESALNKQHFRMTFLLFACLMVNFSQDLAIKHASTRYSYMHVLFLRHHVHKMREGGRRGESGEGRCTTKSYFWCNRIISLTVLKKDVKRRVNNAKKMPFYITINTCCIS